MTIEKTKLVVKPGPYSKSDKWFVSDGVDKYLRDDMTLRSCMMGKKGGTYFDTREEAQMAADKYNANDKSEPYYDYAEQAAKHGITITVELIDGNVIVFDGKKQGEHPDA